MNTKAKGSKNERKSMALLEASGYRCTKSGASLGCFDVIGVNGAGFVLVQCKSNTWPSLAEMESIRDFPCPPNAVKIVHRWDNRKKLPLVKEIP